jgi:glycosyltransferase involved in cell wall biosynthesis
MCPSSSIPLVSVIIAAYNAAADIRLTLASLRAQTYLAFEAIVVDDGSTDETAAIVEEFVRADTRFRLIRQANAGVGAARNTALRHARGTYLAPLDADDVWEPEKLEKQVTAMEQGGADVGLVYCWSRRIDQDGNLISYSHPYTLEGRAHRAFVLRNLLSNSSVPLFRASAVADVGPYLTRNEQAGGQGCEDWDMNLRVSEKYLIRLVPEYLVGYRQKPTCMSVHAAHMSTSYLKVVQRARERAPDLPPEFFRWSAGHFYTYLASKSYQWGFYSWSLRSSLRALRADPILLLSSRVRRFAVGSMLHLLTGGRFRRTRVPPLAEATASPAAVLTAPLPSRDVIDRIELNRWMSACAT